MALFDVTDDARQRVMHQGTFNGAPLSAAAGIAVLKRVATGEPIDQANARAAGAAHRLGRSTGAPRYRRVRVRGVFDLPRLF